MTGDRLQAWNVTLWSIDIPHDYPPRLRFMGPDGAVLLAFDNAGAARELVFALADALWEGTWMVRQSGAEGTLVETLRQARAAGWRPAEERGDGKQGR